jgi:hypothetical protein
MKFFKLFATLALFGGLCATAAADQLTFSFVSVAGNTRDVEANASGLVAGPGLNLFVTDSTTGVSAPLNGLVTISTGDASFYNVSPTLVMGTFEAGGANSIQIINSLSRITRHMAAPVRLPGYS